MQIAVLGRGDKAPEECAFKVTPAEGTIVVQDYVNADKTVDWKSAFAKTFTYIDMNKCPVNHYYRYAKADSSEYTEVAMSYKKSNSNL